MINSEAPKQKIQEVEMKAVSMQLTFSITTQQLSLVAGKDGRCEAGPGDLLIQVGGSSVADANTLVKKLTVTGQSLAPKHHFVRAVVN